MALFWHRPDFKGNVDWVADGRVGGWVADLERPSRRLVVEIYVGQILLGTTCADIFRPDLVQAGIGDGKYGFVFHLPATDIDLDGLYLRVARTDFRLWDTREVPLPSRPDSSHISGSQYLDLEIGDREPHKVDIIFSHCNVPPGQFAFKYFRKRRKVTGRSALFVNTPDNDWYQRGIPRVSSSIAGTARFLRQAMADLKATHVRTIGTSMAAYAAILFGDLLDADAVIAGDPEILLGEKRMRSWEWNSARRYDPEHRDLSGALKRLGNRAWISLNAFDPMEAGTANRLLANGHAPILTKFFHGDYPHIDWREILRDSPKEAWFEKGWTFAAPRDDAFEQSYRLYCDAFDGIAAPEDCRYTRAREQFASVALYDAVLLCKADRYYQAQVVFADYVRFRRKHKFRLYGRHRAEPLYDVAKRFNLPPPQGEAIGLYLRGFLSGDR